MSRFIYHYAECRYAECRYAECRYAKCRYAECQGPTHHYPINDLKIYLRGFGNIGPEYLLFYLILISDKTLLKQPLQ